MEMTIHELGGIIANFVQVGFEEAVRAYDPPQDLLRKSEVKRWLKFKHIELKTFQMLESAGYITAHKQGAKEKSPLYYSKVEIQQALATMKLNRYFLNDKIKEL